ncbi:MAG: branched-chain amino acid transaminase [Acidobacteria bacterium]|nr:branched-chain amino acid transaminase [Acidobacteriota bacterium]MCG2816906.1 branched-chain amino acid transaminase [Candidatus Aminicenantes bacterium]MBU1474071.1 branched-chain amino acid transaminase [Acidobacteriota bacterium]MBU2438085.1 branched-chain amino acid transaminase [Acidobacteriota bacterium]MBU4253593.1 branched-chain amino acid transaminase [Acidobacteriota bacterium]
MVDTTYFPKAKRIWHMGEFKDWSDSFIHSQSHALHYGNSVFEGIRAYETDRGPAVFRLSEHIERLFFSAGVLMMDVPFTQDEIITIIKDVMKENELQSAYIRPLLFYSYGNLGLVPKASPVELIVSAWEWGAYLGEKAEIGVNVYILPWKRIHHSQTEMRAKLGGLYTLSTIGGTYARKKGYDEALYLNLEGNVAEGPGENIFIIKDGVLKTNDVTESILKGITRESILKIAEDQGMETRIDPITKEDLFQADEAFFSGTAVEITSIVQVADASSGEKNPRVYNIGDGKKGEATKELIRLFHETVRGKRPEYKDWLTYVMD